MQIPGPSTLTFLRSVRAHGFLDCVEQLWSEHGDLFQVRLGRRRMVFAMHPSMVERINLTHRANYDKVESYDVVRTFLTGEGIIGATGHGWRRQRKLMAPFYTPKGVRAYAGLMAADAVRMRERWRQLAAAGAQVEMGEEMSAVTASIILQAMFDAATTQDMARVRDSVQVMIDFVNRRATSLPLPAWLPTPRNRRYSAARKLVHSCIAELIAARRAAAPSGEGTPTSAPRGVGVGCPHGKGAPDDLLSRWMRAQDGDDGEPMSDALLRDEAITTFFAGHETTARTMTFAWYALATNPHVAERLHAELDRVLVGKLPTLEALKELPYSARVIREVLRMYPSAPFYARDALQQDQICGYEVTAGSSMMLSPYFTHRHPEFWRRPEVFDPDRWESPGVLRSPAFHPFATGPRICIGNHFSLLETQLLLVILAQRFAPELPAHYAAKWQMGGVLSLEGGLPMSIVERSRPS